MVISSKKRVNNRKKWRNAKYGDVADEIPPKKIISKILKHTSSCYKQKIRVLRRFISPLMVVSSKKQVNNGKKWQNAKNGDVSDETS